MNKAQLERKRIQLEIELNTKKIKSEGIVNNIKWIRAERIIKIITLIIAIFGTVQFIAPVISFKRQKLENQIAQDSIILYNIQIKKQKLEYERDSLAKRVLNLKKLLTESNARLELTDQEINEILASFEPEIILDNKIPNFYFQTKHNDLCTPIREGIIYISDFRPIDQEQSFYAIPYGKNMSNCECFKLENPNIYSPFDGTLKISKDSYGNPELEIENKKYRCTISGTIPIYTLESSKTYVSCGEILSQATSDAQNNFTVCIKIYNKISHNFESPTSLFEIE